MPNHPDAIPPTKENLQFPGGDVFPDRVDKAHELLLKLAEGDRPDKLQKLRLFRRHEIVEWRSITGQDAIYKDCIALGESWGQSRMPTDDEKGPTTFRLGFEFSVAFLHETNLVPVRFHDFSEEIQRMSDYDPDTQRRFTADAWAGMYQSHRRLHDVMAPYADHIAQTIEFVDEDQLGLLSSGIVMPYIFASTTRMSGYLQQELKYGTVPKS